MSSTCRIPWRDNDELVPKSLQNIKENIINTFVLWSFQFQQEKKTNSGYEHFHFILDVSYVATYIIRSDG